MGVLFDNFHFLRPWWLLTAVPAIAAWWLLIRARDPKESFKDQIAPHLLNELLVAPKEQSRIRPTSLLLPLWLVATFALGGPSWRREPAPFAEDQAGLMLVIKMAPSMLADDLPPSRLERVRHKVHDLLRLRAGGKTGLIAYSGSAHLVMPFTDDADVIEHMLEALDPSIMPSEGDALGDALRLASQRIADSHGPASILVVTDGVEARQMNLLQQWLETNSVTVQILAPVADDAALTVTGIDQAASVLNASTVRLTPDENDVITVNRRSESAVVATAAEDGTRWRDDGYFLVPILLLGIAIWSRRGWSVSSK